jgi:hypothetical protein
MAMGPRHESLFEAYVADLRAAAKLANAARANIHSGTPTGGEGLPNPSLLPAAHPRVLGVIIEYFFRCKRLNEEIEAQGGDDSVEPLTFVHEMLSGANQELWDFVATLPYLPLGLRQDDSRV